MISISVKGKNQKVISMPISPRNANSASLYWRKKVISKKSWGFAHKKVISITVKGLEGQFGVLDLKNFFCLWPLKMLKKPSTLS